MGEIGIKVKEKDGPFYNYAKTKKRDEIQSQAWEVDLNWRRDLHSERKKMAWQ